MKKITVIFCVICAVIAVIISTIALVIVVNKESDNITNDYSSIVTEIPKEDVSDGINDDDSLFSPKEEEATYEEYEMSEGNGALEEIEDSRFYYEYELFPYSDDMYKLYLTGDITSGFTWQIKTVTSALAVPLSPTYKLNNEYNQEEGGKFEFPIQINSIVPDTYAELTYVYTMPGTGIEAGWCTLTFTKDELGNVDVTINAM